MKKQLLFLLSMISGVAMAQIPEISIHDLQFVTQQDLQNCNDTSIYFGDTVTVVGIALHDGNLVELASGSVSQGYRPGLWITDTNNLYPMGDFSTVQVHGVYTDSQGSNQAVTQLDNIIAGTIVKVTGIVSRFDGETQLQPINDGNAVQALNFAAAPTALQINVGDLNDDTRVNQLPTGETLEGAFVEIQNVTVTAVNYFSGNSRVSFDVADANGNVINVSDRFLAQKLPSHSTVNPASPSGSGAFVAPVVGLQYSSLKGIVIHSENGCTGNNGRGYELNPFDPSHYTIGVTPPIVSSVNRNPGVPTSSDVVTISATIQDFDGTVTNQTLHYTTTLGTPFTAVPMTLISGTTDEFEADIPANADGTTVYYYIEAEDNDNNTTLYPITPASSANTNVDLYTVRDNGLTISDVQRVAYPGMGDVSPYAGQEVTVTGIVTSSLRNYDLGEVYIQEEGATEWGGIWVIQSSDLLLAYRDQEVTVTGIVEEDFGMTRIVASSVVYSGNGAVIEPISIDPSDTTLYDDRAVEKYEGMLIKIENPGTGMMEIIDENIGFGEYIIGNEGSNNGTRILAGRKSSSSYSSLWFSLVADTSYTSQDGEMEVDAIETTADMSMESLTGIMYYGFSNYKMMPRNNDDLVGLMENGVAVPVDSAQYDPWDTTNSVIEVEAAQMRFFPNPANTQLVVETSNGSNVELVIFDMKGTEVFHQMINTRQVVATNNWSNGLYMVQTRMNGAVLGTEKLIIQH